MSTALVDKVIPLFKAPAPSLYTLLQANIEMLNGLVTKFSALDLTEPTTLALATIAGGQQPQAAIQSAAVLIKAQALSLNIDITDQDANVIAQAVTNGVLSAIQVAVSAPPVVASPAGDQNGNGTDTASASAAA
jgi:hypothetical protein